MDKKNNKIYVEYVCPNCNKNFGNHKYHYNNHINKKFPCKPKNELNQNNNVIEVNDVIEDNDNISSNPNQIIISLLEKINQLTKQNEEFKDDINTLKQQIIEKSSSKPKNNKSNKIINNNNTTNNTNTTNSNNTTNTNNVNMTIQVNNYNNMNYSQINPNTLINTMLKNTGRNIYLMAIEDTFANPQKPQNHNLYISDKNRGYIKKYNDGRWNTDNLTIIETLINNFVDYYKLSIDEIKQKPQIYTKIKTNIQNKLKYLNYCDLEYLANLEDEQENEEIDNKQQIKRCKEFREQVYKDIINLLHDKKDVIINTHKNNK